MRMYMILAAIGLSSLYFFYQPPINYDLYRHYETLHILRRYDLWTVMSGAINKYYEPIESFQQGAPLYLLYAYLISRLQVDQLLTWAERYDEATYEAKHLIIAALVDQVEVNKNYDIKIHFKISAEQFLGKVIRIA